MRSPTVRLNRHLSRMWSLGKVVTFGSEVSFVSTSKATVCKTITSVPHLLEPQQGFRDKLLGIVVALFFLSDPWSLKTPPVRLLGLAESDQQKNRHRG